MKISVIIPCYNHGRYLARAIESINSQSVKDTEIIVVDDGSTDNTKEETTRYPEIIYIYQSNQGLSAARNTGIRASKGDYLVFLDADDWLAPDALKINLGYISGKPEIAFVSGAHIKINASGEVLEDVRNVVESDHYRHLLEGNYIGMHATVMYARWIFDHFTYDTSLKACEDYDLYFKIARKFPVIHHTHLIAYYFIHGANMSANTDMMLTHVLAILERQKNSIRNSAEKSSLVRGKEIWKEYYSPKPAGRKNSFNMRKRIKKHIPNFILRGLYRSGIAKNYTPSIGKIDTGDLNRLTPFSKEFGYDRGGPVDRYYIENFWKKIKARLKAMYWK